MFPTMLMGCVALFWTVAGMDPSSSTHGTFAVTSTEGSGIAEQTDAPGYGSAIRCVYDGKGLYELHFGEPIGVAPFDTLAYRADVRLDSFDPNCAFFLSVQLMGEDGAVVNNLFAPVMPDFTVEGWQEIAGKCAVPPSCTHAQLQLWVQQPFEALVGAPTLEKTGSIAGRIEESARRPAVIENDLLRIVFDPEAWSFAAVDKRCNRRWDTFPNPDQVIVLHVDTPSPSRLVFDAVYLPTATPMKLDATLVAEEPELDIATSMDPGTPLPIWAALVETAPPICDPSPDTELAVPLGEGFLYPTDDPTIPMHLLQLSDGAGLTMPWSGVVDHETGAAVMWFTHDEDDALSRLLYLRKGEKAAGTHMLGWMSQKNRWGYDRTVRYWFADQGRYVALCKRYRQDAFERGRLVPLAEKQKKLPQIARLLGAPNCWFNFLWHYPDPAKRMEPLRWFHEQGIERMLFSTSDCLDSTEEVLSWGWLTSRYDLYGASWPPEVAAKANVPDRTWGYPDDVQILYTGKMKRGWVQKTEHGDFPCYELCPTQQPKWAKRRIPPMLEERTMTAHFIDTTTANPLGECYSPVHPMTRTQDKASRLALLGYLGELGLMAGSEIGVDWAVPVLCYSEGMLSPVPYRNPDAGYLLAGMAPVEATFNYMLNPAARAPLWELVYHDCTVSYWYWGDATNTFPELWHLRNLFNALYATPPLYMILEKEEMYLEQRERIVQTDQFLKPVFEAVGFSPMTGHAFLSDDRKLQQTEFANGAKIVVNFAEETRNAQGVSIEPYNYVLWDKNGNMQAGGANVQPGEPVRPAALQEDRIVLTPVVSTPVKRAPGMRDGTDLFRLAFQAQAPWMNGPVELRMPETLQSNLGFHILDHYRTTIEPLSDPDPFPQWQRDETTGALSYSYTDKEGLEFGGRAEPGADEIHLTYYVKNHRSEPLHFVMPNMCLMLRYSPAFNRRHDLDELFMVFDGKYQSLARTTPTPAEMGRDPWLLILTPQGKDSFPGPKVTSTWWLVDQVADENLMAAESVDGKHLCGYTWDKPAQTLMCNCGNPCLHTGPGPVEELAPGAAHTWRGKIYLIENDPEALLARYRSDQAAWRQTR